MVAWLASYMRKGASPAAAMLERMNRQINATHALSSIHVPTLMIAKEIVEAVARLGVDVRAGVHTGEVESIDGKVGGLAVVIGSRVGAVAGPSEVLVSQTVKDLVAGSASRSKTPASTS